MGRWHVLFQAVFDTFYTSGPNGYVVFMVLTVSLCGAAAYVTGKAIAQTWRPVWQVLVYALLLAAVSRFLHYALFHEIMLSLGNYIVDFSILFLMCGGGYWLARQRQMATQYSFENARQS